MLVSALLFSNCETIIEDDLPQPIQKIIVEGSIENGQPPIVFLSKNFAFFGELSLQDYQQNFVQDAIVKVNVDGEQFDLNEICYMNLDPIFQSYLLSGIGIENTDSLASDFNFCLYAPFDPNNLFAPPSLIGEVGKSYQLNVDYEAISLTSTTTIPQLVPLDSVYMLQHPSTEQDTLYRLFCNLIDPDTLGNYYRYFTQQNESPVFAGISSVFDDLFINGSEFYFPLDRGQPRSANFDLISYGYFTHQDTVKLRWCTIDKANYDFWKTLEFSADAVGPFTSATEVLHNIEGEGGIGIWGGYGVIEYSLIAE